MSLIHATSHSSHLLNTPILEGAQWLSGRVLDSRPKGRRFEPLRRHCVVSLSKNINPSLVLVQPRKTRPFITERLLMGRKESNQTNKKHHPYVIRGRWLLVRRGSRWPNLSHVHIQHGTTPSLQLSQQRACH